MFNTLHMALASTRMQTSIFLYYLIAANILTTLAKDLSTATLITVDQSGHGNFKRIQDAINAVPSNNSEYFFIQLRPGVYKEKIMVPFDKPFITLSGTSPSKTIITWNERCNVFECATLTVWASDFVAMNITIQNTFGPSAHAIALAVSGDRVAFYSCSIRSYQDTLLDNAGNHYYKNCYIEGAVDFICGNAASLFEESHIHSLDNLNGNITAQARSSPLDNTGFTFLKCTITGVGKTFLGRPWGPYSRVIVARSYLSEAVWPQGWNDWGSPDKQRTVYYAEYNNRGPGAQKSKRVKWSHQLSREEAMPLVSKRRIGGASWLREVPTTFKRFRP